VKSETSETDMAILLPALLVIVLFASHPLEAYKSLGGLVQAAYGVAASAGRGAARLASLPFR
jgi:hypothetical protein